MRQKIELADQIPHEPPVDDPSAIRLVIKLPQGTRLERRFSKDLSVKVVVIYDFEM